MNDQEQYWCSIEDGEEFLKELKHKIEPFYDNKEK